MRNKRKNSALPSHQCETRKDLLMVTTTTSKAGTASPSYPYFRVSLAECSSDHFVHKRRELSRGCACHHLRVFVRAFVLRVPLSSRQLSLAAQPTGRNNGRQRTARCWDAYINAAPCSSLLRKAIVSGRGMFEGGLCGSSLRTPNSKVASDLSPRESPP